MFHNPVKSGVLSQFRGKMHAVVL